MKNCFFVCKKSNISVDIEALDARQKIIETRRNKLSSDIKILKNALEKPPSFFKTKTHIFWVDRKKFQVDRKFVDQKNNFLAVWTFWKWKVGGWKFSFYRKNIINNGPVKMRQRISESPFRCACIDIKISKKSLKKSPSFYCCRRVGPKNSWEYLKKGYKS